MDSDIIQTKNTTGNFITILVESLGKIKYKFLTLLFIMFIFISSDVFNERVLSNFDGAVDIHTITNYGIILQGIFFILGYISLEILIDQGIL
jgi:hypothetical protein